MYFATDKNGNARSNSELTFFMLPHGTTGSDTCTCNHKVQPLLKKNKISRIKKAYEHLWQ